MDEKFYLITFTGDLGDEDFGFGFALFTEEDLLKYNKKVASAPQEFNFYGPVQTECPIDKFDIERVMKIKEITRGQYYAIAEAFGLKRDVPVQMAIPSDIGMGTGTLPHQLFTTEDWDPKYP